MPNEIRKIGGGLNPTPKDKRDFKLGQIIKWPKLEELPESFELLALTIKNQGDTDFCSAFMSCGMSELQEGVELNPYWEFAVSKVISGDPDEYGQDLRTAMKAHVKKDNEVRGAIEGNDKFGLSNEEMRYLKNYPEDLKEKAKQHQKQSFFEIAGYPANWTPSDAIKAAIWLFRDYKRAVGIGVSWIWNLSDKRITVWTGQGGGHAMYVRGWDKDGFLIVQNSYGKEAGDGGFHHFSPAVIDKAVEIYKAFVFVDMPENEAKKVCWSWWRRFVELIKSLIK